MPYSDELKFKRSINKIILVSYIVLFLLMCSAVSIFPVIIGSFSGVPQTLWFVTYTLSLFISLILILYIDKKDILEKHSFNEKIYLLISFLDDELKKDTLNFFEKSRFNYILKRVIRYLYKLEEHVDNKFIFPKNNKESQLSGDLRKFMQNELRIFIKQKKNHQLINMFEIINELYAFVISSDLILNHDEKYQKENLETIETKYVELESIISSVNNETDRAMTRNHLFNFVKNSSNTIWFKLFVVLLIGLSIYFSMYLYKDSQQIINMIGVISFLLTIIGLWSKK
jgi:hypothetical protein